jgi:hypothetical protein
MGVWRVWQGVVVVLMLAGAASADAADRPFLATDSAAAEEDDDNVWSVESWFARRGSVRTLSIAAEYAFNPTTSVQLEFARARDRAVRQTGQEIELELKHLFNHIARDGYGVGVVAALAWQKGGDAGWRRAGASLNLPFTWAFADSGVALHVNAGVDKTVGERRAWTRSVALEGEIARRTTVFAELSREGSDQLAHAGVRRWAQRDKLALDLSWQRTRSNDGRASGIVVGIGFYDL